MSDVSVFDYRPSGILKPYVREILWIHSRQPRTTVLMPETILTLVLRQSGSASLHNEDLPQAIISGLQRRTRPVEHAADSSVVIVRFTEVGASAILHDRVDLLYNQTLPLDSLIPPRQIEQIQNTLADAGEVRKQVLAVTRFLTDRLRPFSGISNQIESAVRTIRRTGGRASITAIARHVAMSQSALERHFRAAVGVTPKMLSRLARLHFVCNMWNAGKSLTEIAFEAGYSDQPHLVHDFRSFTGVSPEEFFLNSPPSNLPIFYK